MANSQKKREKEICWEKLKYIHGRPHKNRVRPAIIDIKRISFVPGYGSCLLLCNAVNGSQSASESGPNDRPCMDFCFNYTHLGPNTHRGDYNINGREVCAREFIHLLVTVLTTSPEGYGQESCVRSRHCITQIGLRNFVFASVCHT